MNPLTMGGMFTLGAWVHNLDPWVFRLSGGFGIRWYGLAYVAGFIAAWFVLHRLAKRGKILVDADRVPDLILAAVAGTLIGGRLGYVLLYQPSLLTEFSSSIPWWGLLAINNGGMASHGGMVGIVAACWLFARRMKIPALHVMDVMVLVGPIGVFFGRIANFVNGELLGKVVAPAGAAAPWWSVKFPQELLERFDELPDAQVSAVQAFLIQHRQPGDGGGGATIRRLIEEMQAGNAQLAQQMGDVLTARHPSQLYQAVVEGIVVFGVVWLIWRKPRTPGIVGAWFLIVYGIGRILTELVRLPDSHLAVQRLFGLSRGQWLSAMMVVLGAALLWWVVKRSKSEKVGGWGGKKAKQKMEETESE